MTLLPQTSSQPLLPLQAPVSAPSSAAPAGPQPILPIDRRAFRLWGDPHAVAGDGRHFDNELVGTLTQLKSASGDFELQTTQAHPPGKKNVTLNTSAALKFGKDVVTFDATPECIGTQQQAFGP
jgi:hypothetical protein